MVRWVAVVVATGLAGCGANGPATDAGLRGHYLTAFTPTGDVQLAVAFTATNGVVNGYGWAGVPGPVAPALEPLVVSGQATDKTVNLTLAFAEPMPTGGLFGIFSGQADATGLRGTLSRPSQSLGSTFVSVDTTALGTFELETTGGGVVGATGRAGFGTAGSGFRLDLGTRAGPAPLVTVVGSGRPGRGIHPVADGAGGGLTGTLALPAGDPLRTIVGGTLQIDVSTPQALIGILRGTAKAVGVPDVQMTARFSAGCPSPCR